MMPSSLKNTLLLAVALLVILTGLSISQLVAHHYSVSLMEGAAARSENIAHKLALDTADKILINDLVALQKILDDQIASDASVAYLFVLREGQVLTHTFPDGVPVQLLQVNTPDDTENGHLEKIISQDGDRFIDIAYPIFGGKAGTLRMGLHEAPYRRQVRQLWIQMSTITTVILIMALLVSQWVISRLTRPLNQLTRYAEQIDAGNLDIQVAVHGRTEVTKLAAAFKSMLSRIEDHTSRLKEYNEQLNIKNRELNRAHKQLETSFSISQKIAALPKLNQICRFLIKTLQEVVPCRKINLLVYNSATHTINMATPEKTVHLDPAMYVQLNEAIEQHHRLMFIRQPEIKQLQLPGELSTVDQVALFPIRHHELTIGAMLVACDGKCDCVRQELDIVLMVLHQAAGAIHRANSYEEELQELKQRIDADSGFGEIIGKDPKMRVVFKFIEDVAPTDATVLIQGESGTGKELVARAIHQRSSRSDKPFIVINCSAYPSTLLESELFGYEKGAFTGAIRKKIGKFEQADGGTVFLDEVGEIDQVGQTKLLRVLQQQTIDRLGGDLPIKVNVRILSATNKLLAEEVRLGKFREDLYYRLNVIPINLPPLRERSGDIRLLAQHFLSHFCAEQQKQIIGFKSEAMRKLLVYSWPGNVRELENIIEHAVVLAKGPMIELTDLPSVFEDEGAVSDFDMRTTPSMVENEARLIQDVLSACNGNKTETARKLGISRSTLYEKLKKLNIGNQTIH